MGELFRRFHEGRRRSRSRAVISILVLVLSALLVIVVFVIRRLEPKPPSDAEASFDPDSCARVMEVGCVYKIRPEAGNPLAQWFATAQGLYRHEKATGRFTRYGADHGLPSERVYDVCSEGARVWAATRGGCVRLEAGGGRFTPLRRDWKESAHPCVLIEYFKGHGVFAALDGGGLFRIRSPDSLPVQVMIPDRNTNIRITCLKTLGNTLFIGQEDGFLYSFSPSTGAWRSAVFAPRLRSESFIWDVSFHGGRLLAATSENGLYQGQRAGSDTLLPMTGFPARGAFALAPEEDGFWCGTPFGLWRYHDKEDAWIQFVHPEEKKPTQFQVLALVNDADRLFYGSLEQGCGYLVKKNVEWAGLAPALSVPNVGALVAADSLLFVAGGYQGGTADLFNGRTLQKIKAVNPVDDDIMEDRIQCFAVSGKRLYYGGFTGFGYTGFAEKGFNHFSGKEIPFINDVAAMAFPPSPPGYIGGLHGVTEYFPGNDSLSFLPGTEKWRVTALVPDGDSLWVGTLSHGVAVLDRRARKILSRFTAFNSRITGLCACPGPGPSALFIATQKDGCFRMEKSRGVPEKLALPPGLLPSPEGSHDNDLTALRRVGNSVLLGTRFSGLLIWDGTTGEWKTLTRRQGLISDQIRSLFDDGQYLWVGAYGGFNRLDKRYLSRRLNIIF